MSHLSSNLNARRLELGLTYEEVWDRLRRHPWPAGVKPPSLAVVGHWFNGGRRPRKMEHLLGLCEVLSLTLDEAAKGASAEAQTATEQAVLNAMRLMTPSDNEFLAATAVHLAQKVK